MRTRILLLVLLTLSAVGCRVRMPGRIVLYAQTLPSTRTATWTPNPAADNVVVYKVQLDGGAIQRVLPSACTPTLCSAGVDVPTFGPHILRLIATNLAISTEPTSEQDSPATVLAFTLNQAPNAITGGAIR